MAHSIGIYVPSHSTLPGISLQEVQWPCSSPTPLRSSAEPQRGPFSRTRFGGHTTAIFSSLSLLGASEALSPHPS